jgi:hypothetical protein
MTRFLPYLILAVLAFGVIQFLLFRENRAPKPNEKEVIVNFAQSLKENPKILVAPADHPKPSPHDSAPGANTEPSAFTVEDRLLEAPDEKGRADLFQEFDRDPKTTLLRLNETLSAEAVREDPKAYANAIEYALELAEKTHNPESIEIVNRELENPAGGLASRNGSPDPVLIGWKERLNRLKEATTSP